MKCTFKIGIFSLFILVLLLRTAYAIPPVAPRLNLERTGLEISLNWQSDNTATGYRLYYASYPKMGEINSIDLGSQTSFSGILPNGSAFYVWVSAYNTDGESGYSNIEHFLLDNKVIAFLPANTNTGTQLELGLQEAFARIKNARLEIVWVDVNDTTKLTDLFFGTESVRGYAEDTNVIAVVTATTGQTLALTSQSLEEPLLILSATGTSTQLKNLDDVLTIAPDNIAQSQLIFERLTEYANEQQKRVKYAILLDTQTNVAAYSFDAYNYILLNDIYSTIPIQQSNGITENNQLLSYPQLVGSFSYNSADIATIDSTLTALDMLQPDIVVHIGFGNYFQTWVEKRPTFFWIGSDSNYVYDTYKGKKVEVVTMSGQLKEYGYDAGAFLDTVMSALGAGALDRKNILEATRELGITYSGRTGEKGFYVEQAGSFTLLRPGTEEWDKVK